jgi:2-aminoadipate transaminase
MKSSALSELGRRTEAPPISWLMNMALARPGLISLAAGFTDNESLPVKEARALLDGILGSRRRGREALQYGSTAGDAELRGLSAERLRQLDGRAAMPLQGVQSERPHAIPPGRDEVYSPDRVLITSGSQQLLYLATEALCDPGDIVLVEDPTYFVYLSIVQSQGLRCRSIRLAEDGIDLEHLLETLRRLKRSGELKRVKMLYLVSYFQNPTGVTTRLDALKWFERAAGHPIYLVEDAAYRELRFAGEDVPSALAVKGAIERVVYAGTYSKPFATGVRVGFAVLPEPLLTVLTRIKANHDFGTSNLLQQLLRQAIASCRYEAHLATLRRRYARKAATLNKALREHVPGSVAWQEPRGGLYVWARLPKSVKSGVNSNLFQSALRHDVLYVPGELCYADDPARRKPNHEMRLSFGGATEAEIRLGIARLGATLRELPAS